MDFIGKPLEKEHKLNNCAVLSNERDGVAEMDLSEHKDISSVTR